MIFGILGVYVVYVVGGHQRDIQLPGKGHDLRRDKAIFFVAVVLNFQIVVAFPKDLLIFQGDLPGFVVLPLRTSCRNFPFPKALRCRPICATSVRKG